MAEWSRAQRSGALASVLAIAAWSGAAAAQGTAAPVDPGRDAYLQYCASCHGPDADGKGPMADELKKPPADLTRLSERFGSPLRVQQVLERVDGRDMARAHGSPEMPVWGRRLASNAPRSQGTETQTRGTLRIIIEWLASVQKP